MKDIFFFAAVDRRWSRKVFSSLGPAMCVAWHNPTSAASDITRETELLTNGIASIVTRFFGRWVSSPYKTSCLSIRCSCVPVRTVWASCVHKVRSSHSLQIWKERKYQLLKELSKWRTEFTNVSPRWLKKKSSLKIVFAFAKVILNKTSAPTPTFPTSTAPTLWPVSD